MTICKTKQGRGLVPGYIAYPIWIAFAIGFIWMDWVAVACIQAYVWLFNLDCSKNPVFNCLLISDADKNYFDQGVSVILISVGVMALLGLTFVLLRQIVRERK